MSILSTIVLIGIFASFITFLMLYVEIIATSFISDWKGLSKNKIVFFHVFRRLSISILMSGLVSVNLIFNLYIFYYFTNPIPNNFLEWPLRIIYMSTPIIFLTIESFGIFLRIVFQNINIENTKYTILFLIGAAHNLLFLRFYFSNSSRNYFSAVVQFLISVFVVIVKGVAQSISPNNIGQNRLRKLYGQPRGSIFESYFVSSKPYLKEINVWMDSLVLIFTSLGLILTSDTLSPFMNTKYTIWFIVIFLGIINAKIISNHERVEEQ